VAALAAGLASADTAAVVRTCGGAGLRIDKIGANASTSHRTWDMALRNVSSSPCQIHGYPSIRLLDSGARPIATNVVHNLGPPHTVLLKPFQRGFFEFTYAVSAPCPAAVFAYGIRATPPHARTGVVWYQGKFDLCGPGPANVVVSPVLAHKPF